MEEGQFDLRFDRGRNFFEFYLLSPGAHWTFLLFNPDGSLVGIGSMQRSMRDIKGREVPVAYLLDLRISGKSQLTAMKQWRDFFKKMVNSLSSLREDQRCEIAVTAVFLTNVKAQNALVKKSRGPAYIPLKDYWNVQMLAGSPWGRFSKPEGFTVERNEQGFTGEIIEFITKWDLSFAASEYAKLEATMGPNPLAGFVARNSAGEIVGFVRPWINRSSRTPVVKIKTTFLKILARLAKIKSNVPFSLLHHSLFIIRPDVSAELKKKIARELLKESFKEAHNEEYTVSILTTTDSEIAKAVSAPYTISNTQECMLYQVLIGDQKPLLLNNENVFFEGALS